MTDQLNFAEGEKKKLPGGLNVLTILTYIGCGVFGLFTLFTPMILNWSLKFMDKAVSSGAELSTKDLADIEKGRAAIELSKQHMVPMMIIGIICIILCFLGALWMRKLKKDGYWLYVAGELAPIAAGLIMMGTAQYNGIGSIIMGIGIPVTFVVLYTLQRKHLVNN
jgi:magnesium-transporting ATPase (P-type)